MGVEGFEGVRIHGGLTALDTDGCLLTGMKGSATNLKSGTSVLARERLQGKIQAALDSDLEVWITINNPVS